MEAALKADSQHTTNFRPSFFFWMTLLMAFFVFSGFGMTYWYPMASGTFPPAPPVVHLHGMVYSLWMILLVVQAGLVNVRNIKLHRSLGMFGIALATAVIFMGALITLLGSRGNPAGINYNNGIYLGIMGRSRLRPVLYSGDQKYTQAGNSSPPDPVCHAANPATRYSSALHDSPRTAKLSRHGHVSDP